MVAVDSVALRRSGRQLLFIDDIAQQANKNTFKMAGPTFGPIILPSRVACAFNSKASLAIGAMGPLRFGIGAYSGGSLKVQRVQVGFLNYVTCLAAAIFQAGIIASRMEKRDTPPAVCMVGSVAGKLVERKRMPRTGPHYAPLTWDAKERVWPRDKWQTEAREGR